MEYGICHLSLVPQRKEASDKSEMTNQLVFGELYTILEKTAKWILIRTLQDHYEGWICQKQFRPISLKLFEKLSETHFSYSIELVHSAIGAQQHLPLVLGSKLFDFDGLNFKFLKEKLVFNGQAIRPQELEGRRNLAVKLGLKYLNAPYLWGGKSPFGIDCSGLSQMVFRCLGVDLPRDAYQQVEMGSNIDFVESAQNGDLAFFQDGDKVNHVGIILDIENEQKKIIHASGKVRIDLLDNHGIYRVDTKSYSHKLRLIKAVL